MSDAKIAEYYPSLNEVADFRMVPCYHCGAMVHQTMRGLHVDWHERQKSTERLILDNQPPMDRGGEVGPHGT